VCEREIDLNEDEGIHSSGAKGPCVCVGESVCMRERVCVRECV